MNRFELARATSVAEARSLKAEKPGSILKAGGIDVLDHMKEHLLELVLDGDLGRYDKQAATAEALRFLDGSGPPE